MAGFKSKRAMTSSKMFNMPMVMSDPSVNVLYRTPDGWYLVAFNKETIDWFRKTYADKQGISWRETDDDSYIIYRRRLEMTEEMVTLLKLKYSDALDNTDI